MSNIEQVLDELTLVEKVYMMSGHDFYQRFMTEDEMQFNVRLYHSGGGCDRLGLPKVWFADGPRGVGLSGSTCFPVSMARGASWDVDLEERVGDVMGIELRAHGGNTMANICINVLRFPEWGRAQETYGEDPYLLGEMGAACTRGSQNHNIIATVKHFAANNLENSRFKVSANMSQRVLREVYLPHFKRVVDEGVRSVMTAYNRVNGTYAAHNAQLLRSILKEEWGFSGFVHSDWILGVYGPDAAEAGLDIENPEARFFGDKLIQAVECGDVSMQSIDDSVRRILTTLQSLEDKPDPQSYPKSSIACREHQHLAQEVAEKSMVLLKNEGLLPLNPGLIKRIAVIGKHAQTTDTGDSGSSSVVPPFVVTAFEGIEQHFKPDVEVVYCDGKNMEQARKVASESCVALIFVGYTGEDEGEYIPGDVSLDGVHSPGFETKGGDRSSMYLKREHEELIRNVAEVSPKTVVCMVVGSPVMTERWDSEVSSILVTWYSGMMGGKALARVLCGDVNPSGKLPFTVPKEREHLPLLENEKEDVDYDLYHGYTMIDHLNVEPAYHFGFGLSYTCFSYSCLTVAAGDKSVEVEVFVQNDGDRQGAEIVQLYVGFQNSNIQRPRKLLRGFKKIELMPGEKAKVLFSVEFDSLRWYCEEESAWKLERIEYKIMVGGVSDESKLLSSNFTLDG